MPQSQSIANAFSLRPDAAAVRQLEADLMQLPQVQLGTQHLLHGGLYARTILIPAGTLLTGALMRQDNVCVVYGDITVTTDEGVQRLQGYHVLPAKAGAKRVGLAHADTWWTTLLPTTADDIHEAETQATDEHAALQTNACIGEEGVCLLS